MATGATPGSNDGPRPPEMSRRVLYIFDRPGFERHARLREAFHDPLARAPQQPLTGFVTGGSSGIGAAAVRTLRKLGHRVLTCGRRPSGADPDYRMLDLADWTAVASLVDSLPALDFIGLNAGGMPDQFSTNRQGVELQFASQLFGHYLLAHNLVTSGRLGPGGRIIWMSSGGMYLARLHFEHVFESPGYDKVRTYANVKRAQVVLNEEMARLDIFAAIGCYAMHPGWVDTPGVKSAIPGFHRLTRGRLRTPDEGADTLVWLAARSGSNLPSGAFFFDREPVRTYAVPFTRESEETRARLLPLLNTQLAEQLR